MCDQTAEWKIRDGRPQQEACAGQQGCALLKSLSVMRVEGQREGEALLLFLPEARKRVKEKQINYGMNDSRRLEPSQWL